MATAIGVVSGRRGGHPGRSSPDATVPPKPTKRLSKRCELSSRTCCALRHHHHFDCHVGVTSGSQRAIQADEALRPGPGRHSRIPGGQIARGDVPRGATMTRSRDDREPLVQPDRPGNGPLGAGWTSWRPPADDDVVADPAPPELAPPPRPVLDRPAADHTVHDAAATGTLVECGGWPGNPVRAGSYRDQEGKSRLVWTFRLERYDEAGNRLPPWRQAGWPVL
jgi:hypothetical protein